MSNLKKELRFRVEIDCCGLPSEVSMEFDEREIGTHYEGSSFGIDWKNDDMPETKKWLIEEYGEGIKQYTRYVTIPT